MSFKLNVDWKHILLLALSTFGGAVLANLQQDVGLFQALQSWSTAKPELLGALAAGVLAVTNMARKSFIEFLDPIGPTAVTGGGAVSVATSRPAVPPPPPSSKQLRGILAIPALAAFAFILAGCGGSLGNVVQPVVNGPIPADLVDVYACVQKQIDAKVTSVPDIEAACLKGQLGTVADVVETLIQSKVFGAKHSAETLSGLQREVDKAHTGLAVCHGSAQ